ncbi:MAG: hypothetical protein FWD87_01085 [Spirochaetaceae bacterium]|nr:hypothetical protein [Spirochaetaceae bacterium]
MFKRKMFFSVIIIAVVFFIIGCETTSANRLGEDAPEWVRSSLVDSDYFIGIGFSNTGNEANDINNARIEAFSGLILTIFESIKRSQQHLLPANAEKKFFYSAEAHIIQALTRNHEDIKSGSYNPEGRGYWFHYKIAKTDWARIQEEEQQEIAEFLIEVLSPRLFSREVTSVEILTFLVNGWKFIADSPYPMLIQDPLAGNERLFIDTIENNIQNVLSNLVINIETNNIITEPGQSENFIVSILNRDGRIPGELQLDVFNRANERKVTEVTTNRNGRYSGNVEFRNLSVGRQQLYAKISIPDVLEHISILPVLLRNEINIPAKDFTVTVNEARVVLKLAINGEADIENFRGRTRTLFSREELPIRFSPGSREEKYTIIFTINFMNQPRTSHNLFITNANATVELFREGNRIFSYMSQEYREVGVDMNQAQERVAIRMFNDINRDELLFRELRRAIYGGSIF